MHPAKLAVPAAAAVLFIASPALAASSGRVHRVGSCTARGDYATCVASGTINSPRSIHVHVSATPDQQVTAYWSMTCIKGTGAGGSNGHFSGVTTMRRLVRMPYIRPDQCIVSADAQLSSGGRLRVWITARKRAS